jgi:hypothetical protein
MLYHPCLAPPRRLQQVLLLLQVLLRELPLPARLPQVLLRELHLLPMRQATCLLQTATGQRSKGLQNIFSFSIPLECVFAGFARTNTNDLLQVIDKDLSVTDLAGAGCVFDRFNCTFNDRVVHCCLDFCLWKEIDNILSTAVQLGVTFLSPKSLDLGNGDALHTDVRESFADFIELERLDDGSDDFHVSLV